MRQLPSLIAVSDRRSLPAGGDLVAWCRGLAAAGVEAVWLREKDLGDAALLHLARQARAALEPPIALLVSGRPDVALAAEADGVHLPSDGLPPAEVVRRFGGRLAVGRSTHSLAEVAEAEAAGADYVTFGPVYESPGKAARGAPNGISELARACSASVPVYALGGLTRDRLAEVAAAGAAGAAGIRLFQEPEGLPSLLAAARAHFPRPEVAT